MRKRFPWEYRDDLEKWTREREGFRKGAWGTGGRCQGGWPAETISGTAEKLNLVKDPKRDLAPGQKVQELIIAHRPILIPAFPGTSTSPFLCPGTRKVALLMPRELTYNIHQLFSYLYQHPIGPLRSIWLGQGFDIWYLYVISEVFIFSTAFSSNFTFAHLCRCHGHHKFNTSQSRLLIFLMVFLYPPRSHSSQTQIM